MVIWGMKDFALVPALLDGLDEWVPDLRIERVEESGHWVPEEKPDLVTESLLEFLSW
jgi:epoxide hydrolase 4